MRLFCSNLTLYLHIHKYMNEYVKIEKVSHMIFVPYLKHARSKNYIEFISQHVCVLWKR